MKNNSVKRTDTPSANTPTSKVWAWIQKNISTLLMLIVLAVLLISPEAKTFVLRQLIATGLFNAKIETPYTEESRAHPNADFGFSDEKGNQMHTADLRGKVVFINFWASWCPPCRAEFPSIQILYNRFKDDKEVVFLSLNEDSDFATGKAYLEKENFSFPMYRSTSNIPSEVYSGVLPTTLVLDKAGRIRLHHTGFANYASENFISQLQALMEE